MTWLQPNDWPIWLIYYVTWVKQFCHQISDQSLLGIPMDLVFRFLLLAVLFLVLSRWFGSRVAWGVGLLLLLGKETFDVVGVRYLRNLHWPGVADFLDVLSGLLGLAAGAFLLRRHEAGCRPNPALKDIADPDLEKEPD